MRMPVDDRAALREPGRKPAFATRPRTRDVNHSDPSLFDLDGALLRQELAQSRLVGVAPDRLNRRAERPQLLEDCDRRDVTGVQD